MNLTGKQKAKLRRLANERAIMFQVGLQGLTDSVIKNILDNLKKHEVGRITVLKSCPINMNDIIKTLGENNVYVIYRIGRKLLLYKENPELKERIVL
ncbi:MAG: YhbY family RNA-binding protein [Candidatus Izemoplasmatales bacterium]|jgi:RNA-binding protein|nr:YhbY family RNA-binding protein [Candidatus Izemoplasmatales bacterium]